MPRINPLLAKELRIRMRSWRTFFAVSLFVLALGGFALLFFAVGISNVRYGHTALSEVGHGMFVFLSLMQFALVIFMVPSLAGNAISGERERQTFDLLVCTQLTPLGIVLGKLAAALSAVVLLIVASLPIYGFVFLTGGVSPGQLLILFCILLLTAFFSGCWSVLFSSLFRRTIAGIFASYGLAVLFGGGTLIISSLIVGLNYGESIHLVGHLQLLVNPALLMEWLYPMEVSELLEQLIDNYPFQWGWLKMWHIGLAVNAGLAAFCLWISARAVNPLVGKGNRG